jgi:hypothetical protein
MKYLIVLLFTILLGSCEERPIRTYKVELNTGEIYYVQATSYTWWNSGELEFSSRKGSFKNVKAVMEVNEYGK